MSQVKLENSLAQHQCLFSLIKQCCLKIKEIENYEDLKLKNEVTKYVAKLVEEGINQSPLTRKQKKLINKRSIIIQVIKEVYDLVEEEIKIVDDQIDYNSENKIVTKPTIIGRCCNIVKNVFWSQPHK